MLSVLINAYACGPEMGSEPGMAWNWIKTLANHCKVFVISEGEWKDEIDTALRKLPQGRNIKFFYNPVSEKIRKMCWDQGDWRFYYFYNNWQKKSLTIAYEIIKENQIDIVHQLNMIGFREPGYLWKIKGKPFIWGPVGGFGTIPFKFLIEFPLKDAIFYFIKNNLNILNLMAIRIRKVARRADLILCATKEGQNILSEKFNISPVLLNETGSLVAPSLLNKEQEMRDTFKILWVGRFVARKALKLALEVISETQSSIKNIEFHIVGSGQGESALKEYSKDLGIGNNCKWHGTKKRNEVLELMNDSDILLFTSLDEGTPHVVLESISMGLPVLCHDICGQSTVIDETCGIKLALVNPKYSIKMFSKSIIKLYNDRVLLSNISSGAIRRAEKLSWEEKAKQLVDLYQKVLEK